MRFGTFFFQAAPGLTHADVVHRELQQMDWTEERFTYRGRFFTVVDAHVQPRPLQQPHPPLYQVCLVVPERIENAHPSLQPHFRQLAERLATVIAREVMPSFRDEEAAPRP
jgi:hypothetical protein